MVVNFSQTPLSSRLKGHNRSMLGADSQVKKSWRTRVLQGKVARWFKRFGSWYTIKYLGSKYQKLHSITVYLRSQGSPSYSPSKFVKFDFWWPLRADLNIFRLNFWTILHLTESPWMELQNKPYLNENDGGPGPLGPYVDPPLPTYVFNLIHKSSQCLNIYFSALLVSHTSIYVCRYISKY